MGGSRVGLVATCQIASSTTNSTTCQKRRAALLLPLLCIAFENLVFYRAPDQAMELDEARREANLGHVAGTRQVDLVTADRPRRRSRGQHDHAVRERDRLLEVVGDENYRFTVGRPQLEQLVLHQLPGLDVERGKGFVHEDDLGIEDQRLRQRNAL